MKRWNKAIQENLDNFKLIQSETPNLNVRVQTRLLTIPQMVTWFLYATSVHNDFTKYERYPLVDLKTFKYFTPKKRVLTNNDMSPSSDTTSCQSSSSSSSSASSL